MHLSKTGHSNWLITAWIINEFEKVSFLHFDERICCILQPTLVSIGTCERTILSTFQSAIKSFYHAGFCITGRRKMMSLHLSSIFEMCDYKILFHHLFVMFVVFFLRRVLRFFKSLSDGYSRFRFYRFYPSTFWKRIHNYHKITISTIILGQRLHFH